jgi:hypothetical protein
MQLLSLILYRAMLLEEELLDILTNVVKHISSDGVSCPLKNISLLSVHETYKFGGEQCGGVDLEKKGSLGCRSCTGMDGNIFQLMET